MQITDIPEYHDKKELLTTTPETALVDAAQLLKKYNFGAIVVTDKNKKIKGILTERDFLMKVVAEQKDPKKLKVKDVMTDKIKTAKMTDEVVDSMRRMTQGRFRHLPIVDDQDRAVGMVSLGDFVAVTWHQVFNQLKLQTKASFMSYTQVWLLVLLILAYITFLLSYF